MIRACVHEDGQSAQQATASQMSMQRESVCVQACLLLRGGTNKIFGNGDGDGDACMVDDVRVRPEEPGSRTASWSHRSVARLAAHGHGHGVVVLPALPSCLHLGVALVFLPTRRSSGQDSQVRGPHTAPFPPLLRSIAIMSFIITLHLSSCLNRKAFRLLWAHTCPPASLREHDR